MNDIQRLTQKLIEFRDARDWKKFHNPKDIALSLTLEATEVLEHFQWKNGKKLDAYIKTHKNDIAEELADVFNWVLLLSDYLSIDIVSASEKKIKKNEKKYPVGKVKGSLPKKSRLPAFT